jgi:hypothetical protein
LEADVRRFEYNDAFATTIWIIVVALICMIMLPLLGCGSPTDPDHHDCTYYVEYDRWIGADCEQENDDAS